MAEINVENIEDLNALFEEKMGFPADAEGLEMTEEQLVNFMLLCHQAEYGMMDDDSEEEYEEMDDDELAYMTDLITYKFDYSSVYDQIDQIVSNYNDGQYDDELEENSEEQTSE